MYAWAGKGNVSYCTKTVLILQNTCSNSVSVTIYSHYAQKMHAHTNIANLSFNVLK